MPFTNKITRTFFSNYNATYTVDVEWTPITPVNGKYTVNEELEPNYAIIVRRSSANFYHILDAHFNNSTTTQSIPAYTANYPIYISQKILYTGGTSYYQLIYYVSKYQNLSISQNFNNNPGFYRNTISFNGWFI